MSIWQSGSGRKITGSAEDAFVKNFIVIPDGTVCTTVIKSCSYVSKENKYEGTFDEYFEVIHKICDGDFKGNEVSQKIKCFSGKPDQIDRALNMLVLLFSLCGQTLAQDRDPTPEELAMLQGKLLTIKIREWSMPKADGSGYMEGNFVAEIHPSGAIPTETGIKSVITGTPEPKTGGVETALTRNANKPTADLDGDIPF